MQQYCGFKGGIPGSQLNTKVRQESCPLNDINVIREKIDTKGATEIAFLFSSYSFIFCSMISRQLIAQCMCIAEHLQKKKIVRCFQHYGNFLSYRFHPAVFSLVLVMAIKTTEKN